MSDPTPTITLRGAWTGPVGDPARTFHGTVTHSTHPDVPAGHPCRVTFEHSGQRVTGPGDHGTYVLHATGPTPASVALTRFVSHAAASTQPRDEASEDDWDAVPAQR